MLRSNLTIAFHLMDIGSWSAGAVHLANLCCAIRRAPGIQPTLCLLVPSADNDARHHARRLRLDKIIDYNLLHPWNPQALGAGLLKRLFGYDVLMERLVSRHAIDVVFGTELAHQYRFRKVAAIAWIRDFQHVHFPEMFSAHERASRDRVFLRCAQTATRVVVTSDTVRKDLESFAPQCREKVRLLRPVSWVPDSIYDEQPRSVLVLYNLPERFIYLPGQFWVHKNHDLVFQAIRMLKNSGCRVSVLCTGSPSDYRHTGHFPRLMRKMSELNIREQVIYLGLVPHEHVLQLMRQSICVLSPSLFEGWGYTVGEAQSVGKQVLLSDIPAHREQRPPKATFFEPTSCDDLAEKLGHMWTQGEPGPDLELESQARSCLPDRLRAYGEAFLSLAAEALEEISG
jgi:glycosyltransferase involved in cell wall biosynthesis